MAVIMIDSKNNNLESLAYLKATKYNIIAKTAVKKSYL
jgi:hypothetical protein